MSFRMHVRLVIAVIVLAFGDRGVFAEDCEPKRPCDATRVCSLKVDTRDCEPHWACPDCAWYDAFCHARKLGCEADKGRYKSQCEVAKAAQNRLYEGEKAVCETQKAAEKLDCERIKTQQRLACEAGLDGPFSCTPDEVLGQLRTNQQDGLTDFDELSGAITTPIKTAGGQLSWRETACQASGIGIPYRNSQRSTDGFCTLDVKLESFVIDGHQMPSGDRFIRLELLPGGGAAGLCGQRTISTADRVRFGGPVKIDKHFPGHRWLEVHVTSDFDVLPPQVSTPAVIAPAPTPKINTPEDKVKPRKTLKASHRRYHKD